MKNPDSLIDSLIDKFPGANGFRDEGKVNTECA